VIREFKYNPEDKTCRSNYIFLTKTGPIFIIFLAVTTLILSVVVHISILIFTATFVYWYISLSLIKKHFPRQVAIDFEKKIITINTFSNLTFESPLDEVKFERGSIYRGDALIKIWIRKNQFKYFELLEGFQELKQLIFKNCKPTNFLSK